MSIPLNFRLPNPEVSTTSPKFLLRQVKHEAFAAMLEERSLIIVGGDEQVGKTQTVLQVLHGQKLSRTEQTLYLELQPGQGQEILLSQLLRGLAGILGVDFLKWTSILSNADSAIGRAIDVADERQLCVVIDGLDWLHAGHYTAVMHAVSRYARRSQWIFIGRGFPDLRNSPALERGLFEVGPLSHGELEELARQLRPGSEGRWYDQAAAASQGRPGRFLRLLDESVLYEAFRELGPRQQRWLDVLTGLRFPAPTALLARAVEQAPDQFDIDPQWQELCGRGLVRRVEDGWRPGHGVAYVWRQHRADHPRHKRSDLLLALGTASEPSMALERVRLLLDEGRAGAARKLLAERGEQIIARGLSPELWDLLHNEESEDLSRWRLVAGIHCGAEESFDEAAQIAISEIVIDEHVDLFQLHAIITVLYYTSQFQEAAALTSRCLDHLTQGGIRDEDYELAFRLNFTLTSVLTCLGRVEQALEEIDTVPTRGHSHRYIRESQRASLFASLGRTQESVAICGELSHGFLDLEKVDCQAVGYDIVRTLAINRRFEMARQVLDKLLAKIGTGALVLTYGRRSLILQAIIQYETAQYALCLASINSLLEHCKNNRLDFLLVRILALNLRVETGEFEGLEDEMEGLSRQAHEHDAGDEAFDLLERHFYVDMLRGRRTEQVVNHELPHHDRSYPLCCETRLYHQRVRWGESDEVLQDPIALPGRALLPGLIAASQHAAMRAEAGQARELIAQALEESRRRGQKRYEVAVRHADCENRVICRDPGLHDSVSQFRDMVQGLDSPRYHNQATLLSFFSDTPPKGAQAMATLEILAAQSEVAPMVARRAASLLGEDVLLDELEVRFLAELRRRLDWRQPRALQSAASSLSYPWGIHHPTRSAWRADGATICLARHSTLWNLLIYLAQHEGPASKEELINEVWDIQDYHPLHHDNRLRLAASKLRRRLQGRETDFEFITADDDGYRLIGAVRLVGLKVLRVM